MRTYNNENKLHTITYNALSIVCERKSLFATFASGSGDTLNKFFYKGLMSTIESLGVYYYHHSMHRGY